MTRPNVGHSWMRTSHDWRKAKGNPRALLQKQFEKYSTSKSKLFLIVAELGTFDGP